MKHDRTGPCRQCPFRKSSAAGWLGSYTPELILSHIMNETPFPCHMTVDYEKSNWRDTIDAPNTSVQACAGFLIMTRKFAKLPRNYEEAEHAMRLDRNHPEIFPMWAEFVEHHKR